MSEQAVIAGIAFDLADIMTAGGWRVEYASERTPFGLAESLALYGSMKNGKPRKSPSIVFSFDPGEWIFDASREKIVRHWIGPRIKPWTLRGDKLQTKTWADGAKALSAFIAAAGPAS